MQKETILDFFSGNYAEAFKRFLPDAKPIGTDGEHLALCPLHDDHNPSLSFNSDGKWFCHGCSAKGDFIRFYQLKHGMNGDFPAVLKAIAKDFNIPTEQKPKRGAIVRAHDYNDANGTLTVQKIKYESGGYAWRRPDSNGGWIYNRKGVEPTLYSLHTLKTEEIWFPEGEKDADSLSNLGFTATTLPDGAGSKVKTEILEPLRGNDVIICADNDEPGRKHADDKAKALYGVAASIKILHFPDLQEKGDVSDFIASCQDDDDAIERLALMVEGTEEYKPEAPLLPFQFIHVADLIDNLKPIEWLIDGIMPDHALYYNFGDPGSYKTFMEIDRCICVAAGIDYHGHPNRKQGPAFLIIGEGQHGFARRVSARCIAYGLQYKDLPLFVSQTPTQLMDPGAMDDIKYTVDAMAKEYGPPALVVFDTLARNFGDGDENSTKDMNRVIANLDKAFGNDFCRGLIHHTGHGNKDRARGSIALHGAADVAYRCSTPNEEQVLIECKKMKDAPPAPSMLFNRREILLRIGGTDTSSIVLDLQAEGNEATSKNDKPEQLKKVISLLDDGKSYSDIVEQIGISKPTITRYKDEAIKNKWLTKKMKLTQQGVLYLSEGLN